MLEHLSLLSQKVIYFGLNAHKHIFLILFLFCCIKCVFSGLGICCFIVSVFGQVYTKLKSCLLENGLIVLTFYTFKWAYIKICMITISPCMLVSSSITFTFLVGKTSVAKEAHFKFKFMCYTMLRVFFYHMSCE